MILYKLEKPYSGSSLARIAEEVGEEEDIRLLLQSQSTEAFFEDNSGDSEDEDSSRHPHPHPHPIHPDDEDEESDEDTDGEWDYNGKWIL